MSAECDACGADLLFDTSPSGASCYVCDGTGEYWRTRAGWAEAPLKAVEYALAEALGACGRNPDDPDSVAKYVRLLAEERDRAEARLAKAAEALTEAMEDHGGPHQSCSVCICSRGPREVGGGAVRDRTTRTTIRCCCGRPVSFEYQPVLPGKDEVDISERCPKCGGRVKVTGALRTNVGGQSARPTYEPDTSEIERLKALLGELLAGYLRSTPRNFDLLERVREALGR